MSADVQQVKVLKKQMTILEEDLANAIRDWHVIKSSPGPRCVTVEYPLNDDWQSDVEVEEVLQTRCVHELIDGVPSCSFKEFTDLVVVRVCEDGPAQRAGIKDGDRLMSIGVRSNSWNEMRGKWHQPPIPLQTLAFEVDATKKLPQLLCAAGGPGSGKEDFSAFVATLRGSGMDTKVERLGWEAVQSFQCRTRQRCTRQEILLALQLSGAAPSEDAAECLVDSLIEAEAEQGLSHRQRSTMALTSVSFGATSFQGETSHQFCTKVGRHLDQHGS